jgi:hypothetical protein
VKGQLKTWSFGLFPFMPGVESLTHLLTRMPQDCAWHYFAVAERNHEGGAVRRSGTSTLLSVTGPESVLHLFCIQWLPCMKEKIMAVIEQVREGMHVVAPDGKKIGKVEALKMADPEAVTAEGQTDPETGGLVNTAIHAFAATSSLPHHTAERLLRLGYVKVDRSGLFAGHAYFASDELDRVDGDTLWLKEGQHTDQL